MIVERVLIQSLLAAVRAGMTEHELVFVVACWVFIAVCIFLALRSQP